MGTSVGTRVFVQHGWRACAFFMLALYAFQLGILVLRGPHCPRNHWFGWTGGFGTRKIVVEARERDNSSKAETLMDETQAPEKMKEGLVRHTESGDAANAA